MQGNCKGSPIEVMSFSNPRNERTESMINGMVTEVLRDGVMVYDKGRPYCQPAIFASQEMADKFIAKHGHWVDRVVRPVKAGEIIPLHHHVTAYWGFRT